MNILNKEIFETFFLEKCLVDNSFIYKINQNFNVPSLHYLINVYGRR